MSVPSFSATLPEAGALANMETSVQGLQDFAVGWHWRRYAFARKARLLFTPKGRFNPRQNTHSIVVFFQMEFKKYFIDLQEKVKKRAKHGNMATSEQGLYSLQY